MSQLQRAAIEPNGKDGMEPFKRNKLHRRTSCRNSAISKTLKLRDPEKINEPISKEVRIQRPTAVATVLSIRNC